MRHTAAWNFLSLRHIRLISCLACQPPFHCLTLRRMDGVLSPSNPESPVRAPACLKTQPPRGGGYISHGKVGLAWESAFFEVPRTGGGLLSEVDLAVWCVWVEVLGFPQDLCTHISYDRERGESSQCPEPAGAWCHLT